MISQEQQVKNEILVKHKRETRLQSFGMIIGIMTTMFVAMTMMDMFKLVQVMKDEQTVIKAFVSARTGMPLKVQKIAREELKLHRQEDIIKLEELDLRILYLEKQHE